MGAYKPIPPANQTPENWTGVWNLTKTEIITGISSTYLHTLKKNPKIKGWNNDDKTFDLPVLRESLLENKLYPGTLRNSRPEEDTKSRDEEREWSEKKIKYSALREELKFNVEKNELLEKKEVIESIRYWTSIIRSVLESKLISELPPKIEGKPAVEISKHMREVITLIVDHMAKCGIPLPKDKE